jgi:hypothetical protein
VFHFNKKHLEDETVPMWIIKSHGVTFYINHLSSDIAWSTKETPDNEHTKGSIKFKDCKLSIDDDNCATITKLSLIDKATLKHPKIVHARIIASANGKFHMALVNNELQHSTIKHILGACSSGFIVCDLLDPKEVTFATLKYGGDFRIMKPNETYYKEYEKSGNIIEVDYEEDDTPYEYT